MNIQDLADSLNTPKNREEYQEEHNKSWFVQLLIESKNVETYPGSPLCDFVEDELLRVIRQENAS